MELQSYVIGMVGTNCYIVTNEIAKEAIIIDPPEKAPVIESKLKEQEVTPVAILLTHGHFDHIMAAGDLRESFHIPVLAFEAERGLLGDANYNGSRMVRRNYTLEADQYFKDKEVLTLAGIKIKVLHTPGHTAGGVCYYFEEEKILISGDTLFRESVGRTDLPTGNHGILMDSIRRQLMALPDEVTVYPGHGDKTTIGYERTHNPFIGENDYLD
jgi:glyoxylase-like metal-dependent hydrolase (beta-lactamase superfamily II)